jgi:hypothetical protein
VLHPGWWRNLQLDEPGDMRLLLTEALSERSRRKLRGIQWNYVGENLIPNIALERPYSEMDGHCSGPTSEAVAGYLHTVAAGTLSVCRML